MDRIDRILLAEQELTPDANFRARVMEAVRRQGELPPIPFPWVRFTIGFIVAPVLLLALLLWLQPVAPAGLLTVFAAPDPRWLWAFAVLAGTSLILVWSLAFAVRD